ncbi:hypothetical protein WJX81_003165 [Elliptochloris bilobata]|uniref:Uncharacterized protein n=1 Tax=Elliptochloris bilobata TaxID=381761 RepID=A0AAW1RNL5_9CHLO
MDVPCATASTFTKDGLYAKATNAAQADWGEEASWVLPRDAGLSSSLSSNVSAGSYISAGEASPRPLLHDDGAPGGWGEESDDGRDSGDAFPGRRVLPTRRDDFS